ALGLIAEAEQSGQLAIQPKIRLRIDRIAVTQYGRLIRARAVLQNSLPGDFVSVGAPQRHGFTEINRACVGGVIRNSGRSKVGVLGAEAETCVTHQIVPAFTE